METSRSEPHSPTAHVELPADQLEAHSDPARASQPALVRILQRYFVPRWFASLYYMLKYRCLISMDARVQLSKQISFGKGTVVKPFAVIQTQGGRITFGRDCAISSFNHISTGTGNVNIGHSVRLGPNVTILGVTRDFRARDLHVKDQPSIHGDVTVGDDVFIGAGAVILPGCRIGNAAVIGANSVVNRDVRPYTIVAGVPAKTIGERSKNIYVEQHL